MNRLVVIGAVLIGIALGIRFWLLSSIPGVKEPPPLVYQPRQEIEPSGFLAVFAAIEPWRADASLRRLRPAYRSRPARTVRPLDLHLQRGFHPMILFQKASLFHAKGDPASAYKVLEEHRRGSMAPNWNTSGSTRSFTTWG